MKNIYNKIKPLFYFAQWLFPYALIFYLILFLLENLFNGIVSNNFELNWVLGIVMFLAFLGVFAPIIPEEEIEEKPQKNDYLLIVIMGVIGGIVIYYKLEVGIITRLITSGIVGVMITFLGYYIFTAKDEEEILENEEVQKFGETDYFVFLKHVSRIFLQQKVQLPIFYVLFFLIFSAFLIPKNFSILLNHIKKPVIVNLPQEPSPPPVTSFFWDDYNNPENIEPSKDIIIKVLNGGGESGLAKSFSSTLKENGFNQVSASNADNYNYIDALIIFKPEDKAQASLIGSYLKEIYPLIMQTPAEETQNGIVIILGKQTQKVEEIKIENF